MIKKLVREIDNYVFNHIHLYINLLTLNLKEFSLELYAKKSININYNYSNFERKRKY